MPKHLCAAILSEADTIETATDRLQFAMLSQNLTVHGLWIGERLSLMEQLTLRSFVA
ncbi:MAG: hypothetical protein ACLP9L_24035 [Thermoguttaceae bacterium]